MQRAPIKVVDLVPQGKTMEFDSIETWGGSGLVCIALEHEETMMRSSIPIDGKSPISSVKVHPSRCSSSHERLAFWETCLFSNFFNGLLVLHIVLPTEVACKGYVVLNSRHCGSIKRDSSYAYVWPQPETRLIIEILHFLPLLRFKINLVFLMIFQLIGHDLCIR